MSEPRWLSSEERRAWLALSSLTTRLPAELDSELNKAAKITLFDYHVLAMLSEAEGGTLPMSRLAERTNSSLSRLSHVVKKLQGRGWLERTVSADDARVTVVRLSRLGHKTVEELAPEHVETVRRALFDALDDRDVADLARVAAKVVAHHDPQNWIFSDPSAG